MIYEISISEERTALINIQADSKDEAIGKAFELLDNGDIDMSCIELDTEVTVQNETDEADYGDLDGVYRR